MTQPATDVLSALRAATAERHEALDGGLPIGRDDATLEDYFRHLRMLHAWLAPLQAWLSQFHDGPQALPAKDRLGVIEADLVVVPPSAAAAGSDEPPSAAAAGSGEGPSAAAAWSGEPPSAAAAWSGEASAAYRWGVCYVIEGSQLGGAVLYQRLKDRLAPHPLNYLRGEAEGPGPRWRVFMQAIKAEVVGEETIAQACRGACDAFDRILALR